MSNPTIITITVCITILIAIYMVRSTIMELARAKKENFTFIVYFFGSSMSIYRGTHKPPSNHVHEKKQSKARMNEK